MKAYYTVGDVAAMTGLSVRTIRSYLSSGLLEGEKVDGAWRFTGEQFGAFLGRDMVRQSVRAKADGTVLDFLNVRRRKGPAACLVWDWPAAGGGEEAALRERLLERVNALGLACSYRLEGGMVRVILSGPPAALGALLFQAEEGRPI